MNSISTVPSKVLLFYRDVVTCYSKAHFFEYESCNSTILNQTVWGNRFIMVRKKGKKNVLVLRNWIRRGVRFVKDLVFENGLVDRNIYNRIDDKQNFYIEFASVKKTLYPYAQEIVFALSNEIYVDYDNNL